MSDISGNSQEIKTFFDIHCQSSIGSTKGDDDIFANQIINLMKIVYALPLREIGSNIEISYKDLTDLVFDNEDSFLLSSNALSSFRDSIQRQIIKDSYCNTGKADSLACQEHFMPCYDKIIRHISLAQTQREYIKKEVRRAELAAKKAQEISNAAKESAMKAEKTYNTMFANYVTILGIFTAIIVTIFGGLNVVDTVISYGNTYFSTIVFLAALVLMCVVCLLYFLAKIILKLNGKDDDNQRFTLECLFGVVFIVCIGLIAFAWCASPAKITPDHPTKTEQKAAQ